MLQRIERFAKFSSKRKYGIELEFSNHPSHDPGVNQLSLIVQERLNMRCDIRSYEHTQDNFDYWVAKTDGSCGVRKTLGTELASPILSGSSKLKEASELLPVLEEKGFTCGVECGNHVHVNVSDFPLEQIKIMTMYWLKIERLVMNGTPVHRRNNQYCKMLEHVNSDFMPDQNYTPDQVWRVACSGRNAINVSGSTSRRPTVEFRFGDMTMNPEVVKNRVRFLVWFVDICKILPAPDNLNWFTPKQAFRMLGLWNVAESAVKYSYSPAIQSMREWMLARIIEHAGTHYSRDKEWCREMIEQVRAETASIVQDRETAAIEA